jgi:RNA polymerase sigma factor (sigma-70 family)
MVAPAITSCHNDRFVLPKKTMADEATTFASLLDGARRGEPAAIELLTQQYEPKLRMVARVLLGPALRPHLDSIDLVQSVHRSLMVGLREDRFDIGSPENLIGLALTMVRRKAARQWRRARRQQRLQSAGDASGVQNPVDVLLSLSSPGADPAQQAALRDQVERLCQSLSATEQTIVDLRLQGHTTEEIARQVELSPVALRVRLTRLRQRLRAAGVLDDWL